MRKPDWADRLSGWLPAGAARDWYRPALADLRIAHLRGDRSRARFAAAVLLTFLECWRLAALRPQLPRKDVLAMLGRDLRHALRLFRREPAFTAAAVLTLALGIGANTALFAIVEAVLLRPLPFAAAEDLVVVKHRDVRTGISKEFIAIGDLVDLRARQQSFESLAAYGGQAQTLVTDRDPMRVDALLATPDLFSTLGVTPVMGRAFTAEDARENAVPVAIVSYQLWQSELGSAPDILQRSIQLGSTRRQVVGVMPAGFRFPPAQDTDVILPLVVPAAAPAQRKSNWTFAVGRLRPGATIAGADAELAALSRQMEEEHPRQNQNSLYYALTLRDALVGDTKRPLLLMLGAVGFVLLIACANVGNLLLARSLARQQELAMRLALGAGRARLAMQLLTEALVLSLAGGVTGVLVAWQAAPALAAMIPQATPIPGLDAVSINAGVLSFSLGASMIAALVFSAVASIGLTREGTRAALITERRTTASAGARRAASALVACEIAMAVVLLVAAGLTLRSFANLITVNPGFAYDRVATMQVSLPPARYPTPTARGVFYDRLFAVVEQLPGVRAIGAGVVTPLTGNNWTVPLVRPEHPLPEGQRPPDVGWQSASGGYFEALKIPLRRGRLFDARDTPTSAPVAVISDAIAARFFPGEDPIGKRVGTGDGTAEIVGVVGDIRRAALTDEPRADLYFPFERFPQNAVTLFVRTDGDAAAIVPALRTALRDIEPAAVLFDTRPLADIAAESAALSRLAMSLLAGFALVAVALAAIGIYGVMSYSVRRRTRELGTRVALGASRGSIVWLVMRQAAVIAAIGVVLGLATGLAAARTLSVLLYGVPPWDPVSIVAAVAVLTATALVAGYIPARRAARVDPAATLASE